MVRELDNEPCSFDECYRDEADAAEVFALLAADVEDPESARGTGAS